jgi:hypothetical protein
MPIYLPVTTAQNGHPLEVWGCVRPVQNMTSGSGSAQVVDIEFKPAAGGPFTTIKQVPITDPDGYFDTEVTFPLSGTVRTAWSYPSGVRVESRTVSVTIN